MKSHKSSGLLGLVFFHPIAKAKAIGRTFNLLLFCNAERLLRAPMVCSENFNTESLLD